MKKIYSSALALMILIVLFTTVSYAWLYLATVNTIENISLTASGGNNLEISLDGTNYKTNITGQEILEHLKKLKFKDVTSNDGINFLQSYKNPHKAIKNKDYLSVTFYFRTTTQYTEIHLSDLVKGDVDYDNPPLEGTYITSKGMMFKSKVDFQYGENTMINKGDINKFYAKDAMRVSFVEKDIVTNELINQAKIFDLSGDEERGFGKTYGALSYLNKIKSELNTPPTISPNTIYELSTFSDTDPVALNDKSKIVTLKKTSDKSNSNRFYYQGAVVMNVWLEGWDADAFDAIYDDLLKMQFSFKAVMPENVFRGDIDD